jgi:hypothetical protein
MPKTFGAQGIWEINAAGKMLHAAQNNDRFIRTNNVLRLPVSMATLRLFLGLS